MPFQLTYTLSPPEREASFRDSGFKRDIRIAVVMLLLAVVFHLVALSTDYSLLRATDTLSAVWGLRGAGVIIDLLALILVWRCRSFAVFDNILFAWSALLILGTLAANALFPADYTVHVAWDLLLALAVYAVAPLSLKRQVVVALMMTTGDLALFAQVKTLAQPVAFYDILSAFICANIIGVFISRELHLWRRQQFVALQNEVDAKRRLEAALQEVKTLKGIIPICANCKKVRTDEGIWKQIEAYVREHSDADFTHGICPGCIREHYPQIADRVLAMGKKAPDGES